jgi:hypothetical protein
MDDSAYGTETGPSSWLEQPAGFAPIPAIAQAERRRLSRVFAALPELPHR